MNPTIIYSHLIRAFVLLSLMVIVSHASAGEWLGADWFNSQPADHYTLQLVSTPLPERLEGFAERHGITSELAHLVTHTKDGSSHVLVYGVYASYSDAKTAAESIKGVTPWVRQVGDLQGKLVVQDKQAMVASGARIPTDDVRVHDSAWLWSQNPSHFTIQIASGRNKASLLKTAMKLDGMDPVALYNEQRSGSSWYSLLYGDFSSRAAAQSGLSSLPEAIRRNGPWVKSFARVHDEMSMGL